MSFYHQKPRTGIPLNSSLYEVMKRVTVKGTKIIQPLQTEPRVWSTLRPRDDVRAGTGMSSAHRVNSLPTPVPSSPSAQAACGLPPPAPSPARYSPLLGDGARLRRGGSGGGRRPGRRRGSPRFTLIGTRSLLGPAQQMARQNPQPPARAARVWVPLARARLARRLRHGFRLVPPPEAAGRG